MEGITYFLVNSIISIFVLIVAIKFYLTYSKNKKRYNMYKDNIKEDMRSLKYVVQDCEEEEEE